jgi:hypothetical protein
MAAEPKRKEPDIPTPRPMSEFDPTQRAFVHDKFNNTVLDWRPEWAVHYREYGIFGPDGKVLWDGRILDGWRPSA